MWANDAYRRPLLERLRLPGERAALTHEVAYRRILTWLLRPMAYQMKTASALAASMGKYVGVHIRGETTKIFEELPLEAYMRCVAQHFGPDMKVPRGAHSLAG